MLWGVALSLHRLQLAILVLFLNHRTVRLRSGHGRRIADALGIGAHHLGSLFSRGRLLAPPLRCGFLFRRLLQIRAHQKDTGPERLLQQVRATALRALFCHRLQIRREVALGIIRATPEDIAPPRATLSQIALAAFGALHPFNQVLLHVFALGIAGAGDELAVRSLAQH